MTRKPAHPPLRSSLKLTLRGLSPELVARLRATAKTEGWSLNQTALRFLKRGIDLSERLAKPDRIGKRLDAFVGGWTKEQADSVLGATRDFERTPRPSPQPSPEGRGG